MSAPVLSSLPLYFTAGDSVEIVGLSCGYSSAEWSLQLILSRGTDTPTIIDAIANGQGFDITIPAETSANLPPGKYQFLERVTGNLTGMVKTAATGSIIILPNLAVGQQLTHAGTMLSNIDAALLTLSTGTDVSVSFNGQSFTKRDVGQLNRDRTYWAAAVIREQDELAALRGEPALTSVGIGRRSWPECDDW